MPADQITLQIIKSLKEGKKKEFHGIVEELQPYDIARVFEELPEKHHTRFLVLLSHIPHLAGSKKAELAA